jgi:hypothetical protein
MSAEVDPCLLDSLDSPRGCNKPRVQRPQQADLRMEVHVKFLEQGFKISCMSHVAGSQTWLQHRIFPDYRLETREATLNDSHRDSKDAQ